MKYQLTVAVLNVTPKDSVVNFVSNGAATFSDVYRYLSLW